VCDIYAHRVSLFTYDGALVTQIGAGYARSPFAVATDDHGNVYMTDYNRYTVDVFGPAGSTPTRRGSMGAVKARYAP
jgi:hypothetical protein